MSPAQQRGARKLGNMPSSEKVGMPPTYSIWQACRRNDVLWWDGGLANQPFVLMQEFAVYDDVNKRFERTSAIAIRPAMPEGQTLTQPEGS